MMKTLVRWLAAGLVGLLAACAFITVNVYFPEKDVKQAYKSLDEMLMKQNAPEQGSDVKEPEQKEKAPEQKPVSWLRSLPGVSFVAEASAQDDLGTRLATELAGIPEVQKAYEEMRNRLTELNALRDSGVVGEAADGSVALRDQSSAKIAQPVIQAENANRKTVIQNMAKAILRMNKQPETKDAMKQVIGKAAATFAETKREEAKAGWYIQLANGRWVQK
jgi:uncharacterized protein YdbL (DUF1318 family)